MGIFRVVKTKDYTIINNYLCKDRRLSLKGKGLLTVMLSLPEDWDYTIRGLSAILLEGETDIKSIRSYIITCVYNSITACAFEKKQHKKRENKAINLFNSFPQRQYNFDDMDNSLIIINQ